MIKRNACGFDHLFCNLKAVKSTSKIMSKMTLCQKLFDILGNSDLI